MVLRGGTSVTSLWVGTSDLSATDVLSAFNSGYPGFLLPRGLSELGAVLGAVRTVPPENEAPVEVPVNTVPTGAGHPQVCEYPVPRKAPVTE